MNSALRYGKQSLTWGVVVSVIAWSMGLAALLTPFTAAQAVSSGDLIKASQAAVYYYGEDGKRYVFPNQKTYNTWYPDFSGVVTITDSELAAIPIGGNATYKPGVKMVKITTDPKVYAVDANGVLRPIADEATATALYGSNWNQQIDDVPDAFFTNYSVGAPINSGGDFDPAAATAAAVDINDDKNLSSGGTVGGGSLTVSLAADTPATQSVPGGVSRVAFTKVNLTNNTALDAVVDQLVVKRLGLAQNEIFSSVDVLGSDMLPLNEFSKNIGSEDTATVNDDFTVPANSTMSIYLAGNTLGGAGTTCTGTNAITCFSGELPILALNSVTLKGGGQVTGSFPVAGNHHVVNGTLSVGTATVTPGGNEPAASTQEIGTKDFTASSFKVAAGSGEDLTIRRVIFKNNGSADIQTDVENIRLINANTSEVLDATPEFLANDEDKFAMDINRELEKGDNLSFDVRYDVADGSAKTVDIDIDQQADLEISGDEFGFNILGTFQRPAGTANSSAPFYAGPTLTIGNGTLRFESVSITPTNIAEGLDDTVIGKFKAVAEGEPIEVTSIGWSLTITTSTTAGAAISDVTNLTVREEGGSVIAGPQDVAVDSTTDGAQTVLGTATTTDSFIVPTGETVYEIIADLSSDFASDDNIQARLNPNAVTARGEVSGNTITPTPGSEVSSSQLTIRAATLAVSVSSIPAAQSIVSGAQDFNAANYVLDGTNSGSDVRVTSVKIAQHHTGASFPDNLSGWKLWIDGVEVPVNSESTSCSGTCAGTSETATTTLTINSGDLQIVKGTSKTLGVTTDVGTGATSGTFSLGLSHSSAAPGISGIDSDAQTITPTFTASDGQAMTLASGGTLDVSLLADPAAATVVGGSKVEVGRFSMEPDNEGVDFNFLGFTINTPDGGIVGNQDEIGSIEVCQVGGSCFGPVSVDSGNATITPNGLSLDQGDKETFVLNATFNDVDTGSPAQAGAGLAFALTNIDVDGTSVGSSSVTVNGLGNSFNTFTVYKSIPVVAKLAFTGSDLITGTGQELDLYKFSVSADSEDNIALYKFTFGISTTTISLSTTGFKLYESDTDGGSRRVIANNGDFTVSSDASNTHVIAYLDVNDDNTSEPAKELRELGAGSTKYYVLVGTTGTGHDGTSDNESIATVMAGDGAFAGTSASSADGVGSSGDLNDFVWSDLDLTSQAATTTATNGVQWFNGYRIPGIENTSSTPQVVTD